MSGNPTGREIQKLPALKIPPLLAVFPFYFLLLSGLGHRMAVVQPESHQR